VSQEAKARAHGPRELPKLTYGELLSSSALDI
jgi:hypothetical protein